MSNVKKYDSLAIIKAEKDTLPEEYQFLLDPAFQEEIEAIEGNPDKIMAAASVVGDQIGEENVDKQKVEELVGFLRQQGLLDGGNKAEDDNGLEVEGQKDEEETNEIDQEIPEKGEKPIEEEVEEPQEGNKELPESEDEADPEDQELVDDKNANLPAPEIGEEDSEVGAEDGHDVHGYGSTPLDADQTQEEVTEEDTGLEGIIPQDAIDPAAPQMNDSLAPAPAAIAGAGNGTVLDGLTKLFAKLLEMCANS